MKNQSNGYSTIYHDFNNFDLKETSHRKRYAMWNFIIDMDMYLSWGELTLQEGYTSEKVWIITF